jgi:hypothetical protein
MARFPASLGTTRYKFLVQDENERETLQTFAFSGCFLNRFVWLKQAPGNESVPCNYVPLFGKRRFYA